MFLVEMTNTRMVIATLEDTRDWNYNKVNWTSAEPRFLVTGILYLKPSLFTSISSMTLKATFYFTIRVGFLSCSTFIEGIVTYLHSLAFQDCSFYSKRAGKRWK